MSQNLDSAEISIDRTTQFVSETIRRSGLTLRDLSKKSGISKSRIDLLKKRNARLTVEDILRLSGPLGFEPSRALGPWNEIASASNPAEEHYARIVSSVMATSKEMVRQMGKEMDPMDLVAWHHQNGGRLEGYEKFQPYIGLFSVNSDCGPAIEARQIGQKCLAANSLQTPNSDQVNKYIQSLNVADREAIAFTYLETRESRQWKMFPRSVRVEFPGAGPAYVLNYATLLMTVTAPNGSEYILNFSNYLSSSPIDADQACRQEARAHQKK